MNKKLISVIVPIYNVEKYIDKCIRSIVMQTHEKLQILLVDDGSTDQSLSICRMWEKKDERIYVISRENRGLVAARLSGLKMARGEYIGFVDGDDYIDEDMYEKLLQLIEKWNVEFAYCGMYSHFEGSTREIDSSVGLNGKYEFGNRRVDFLKNYVFYQHTSQRMYTGAIFLGLYQNDFIKKAYSKVPLCCAQGEDFICLIQMILSGQSMYITNEPLYHYLVREDSLSHAIKPQKYLQICRMIEAIEEICKQYNLWEELQPFVEAHLNRLLFEDFIRINPKLHHERFSYPNIRELIGKKVILYAAGDVGQSYYGQLSRYKEIDIVTWIDQNTEQKFEFREIEKPQDICKYNYDIVIIAVYSEETAENITSNLQAMGINKEKIIWRKPLETLLDEKGCL